MAKYVIENVHIHSLNMLNFVCIAGFDFEKALENAKLTILELIVLQISFSPSQPWCREDQEIPLKRFFDSSWPIFLLFLVTEKTSLF